MTKKIAAQMASACASRDQAEVRDSGVRQHALAVCLRDCHERAQQERQAANKDNQKRGSKRNRVDRRAFDEHEYARLNHGGRMQQSRGGRRRNHVWNGI